MNDILGTMLWLQTETLFENRQGCIAGEKSGPCDSYEHGV
jgi:hypothetical protein